MKTFNFQRLIIISLVLLCAHTTQAQVTVGSDIPPTRAALMEIKTQQTTGILPSIIADGNITTEDGGFLLPRVKLVNKYTMEPFIPTTDTDWVSNANSLKERHAGLMVYNLENNGVFYPGVYTWDGEKWTTSQANTTFGIVEEPKYFTFYEQGTETVQPLKFEVDGDGAPFTYQWYQITGGNVHVRIGEPVSQGVGGTTDSYTPTQVVKGTTMIASNTGFYKFYCVAENTLGQKLESQVAEVAVGCGGKNNSGEWISFMCFNLGAQAGITIDGQKNFLIGTFTNDASSVHTYISGEEKLWGDLYQWGRIADGHEKRTAGFLAYSGMSTSEIGSGNSCTVSSSGTPLNQILRTSAWYGKVVVVGAANWNPIAQSDADVLWRSASRTANDPCSRFQTDGTLAEFWHDGTNGLSDSPACVDTSTGWRIPSQDEWGSLYKGGTISGIFSAATANTWEWYPGTATNYSRGAEIKPDGVTTTLFLPASGHRLGSPLYNQGGGAVYWTATMTGTANAYGVNVAASGVGVAGVYYRSYSFALRCIKN